jgi:uncharacterized protein YjbJ (UPF0337 family)
MSWRSLQDRWTEVAEAASVRWERLTARDLRVIAGHRERLVGILQQRYGYHRRTIDREVRVFTRSLRDSTAPDLLAPQSAGANAPASWP